MITINLLPDTHRPSRAGSIQHLHRSPLALMVAAGLVGLAGLLAGWRGVNHVRLTRVRERLQVLAPKKGTVTQLKASIATLQRQQHALEEANRQRSAWAPRLNAISDLTPPGIWFTGLVLDPQKLVLQGAAVKQRGEEMTLVNRFVQDMKQDPRLAAAIGDIQLDDIRNVRDGEVELMEFTITCRLAGRS